MSVKGGSRGSRSPFVIDISRLGRRAGSMRTVVETVPSPSRIGLDLVAIAEGAPVALDLTLQSVGEGVLVTGSVSAPTMGECARCLTPVDGDVEVELVQLFAYPDSETEATTEEDEVGHVITVDHAEAIDLEQTIVDAVGLALPFSPLCRDDCAGLCTECGVPLADAGPEHHHDAIDPRWAKLGKYLPPNGSGGQE